jgi:hypothetical protein
MGYKYIIRHLWKRLKKKNNITLSRSLCASLSPSLLQVSLLADHFPLSIFQPTELFFLFSRFRIVNTEVEQRPWNVPCASTRTRRPSRRRSKKAAARGASGGDRRARRLAWSAARWGRPVDRVEVVQQVSAAAQARTAQVVAWRCTSSGWARQVGRLSERTWWSCLFVEEERAWLSGKEMEHPKAGAIAASTRCGERGRQGGRGGIYIEGRHPSALASFSITHKHDKDIKKMSGQAGSRD